MTRIRIEMEVETDAFVPECDVRNVPDADALFGAAMSGYEQDDDRRIVSFKIKRLPKVDC